ncbi:MAG: nucleoside-diphosphate kinase [Bryobacterales bacterium]|nr:nucleoside-diphosphate kinase [Bryobacterales bacterium]
MSQLERTFAIIKPDAVAAGNAGAILATIEKSGFAIRAMRRETLSKAQAEGFYAVHKERSFFDDLIRFMTEGPVVLLALEAQGAIQKWRVLMGPTDPAKAPDGTIRKMFGTNIERNAVHGSDGSDTAAFELGYFFRGYELR